MKTLIDSQKAFFASGATRTYEFRQTQLEHLAKVLRRLEPALLQALRDDLGKSSEEAYLSELAIVENELELARRRLRDWMRPVKAPTPLHLWPARSLVYREPRGVVLIIGPWNYPLQLVLVPLIGALAAGCTAVIKPSELAPATAQALEHLVRETFAPEHVAVVPGGVEVSTELLAQNFDHIFFTGSPKVGRIVYEAAAKNLTPVTLELGGKSPAIVTEDADVETAARRLVWGKFLNAGQTCVAPDYVYVHESVKERFLACVRQQIVAQLGSEPEKASHYPRLINTAHFDRLEKLIASGRILQGGERARAQRFFAPTLLVDVTWDDPVMQEEIFGPVLPVLTYSDWSEVVREVGSRPRPLAAYLFARNPQAQEKFLNELSFGGGCIGDCVVHLSNAHLPFGGTGASGMGSYHGERTFLTFSHEKSVLKKPARPDVWLRYPPYTAARFKWLRRLMGISRWLD